MREKGEEDVGDGGPGLICSSLFFPSFLFGEAYRRPNRLKKIVGSAKPPVQTVGQYLEWASARRFGEDSSTIRRVHRNRCWRWWWTKSLSKSRDRTGIKN